MTDEKQFGNYVEDDHDIVSAEDLLHLQTDDPWDIGFPTSCTVCTSTCAETSVFV